MSKTNKVIRKYDSFNRKKLLSPIIETSAITYAEVHVMGEGKIRCLSKALKTRRVLLSGFAFVIQNMLIIWKRCRYKQDKESADLSQGVYSEVND